MGARRPAGGYGGIRSSGSEKNRGYGIRFTGQDRGCYLRGWAGDDGEPYRHFLGIAQASNFEMKTQLALARELGFATPDATAPVESLSAEVGKMLTAMLKEL